MDFVIDKISVELGGRQILGDLSFALNRGERVVVLGVNGCGKTTLLRVLNGLTFPAQGEVRYAGNKLDAEHLNAPDFRRRFRSEVALLFQNVDAMLFNPTVADEIAFGPRQLGRSDIPGRVQHWAAQFEVLPFLDRPPFELSGGEKRGWR